MPLLYAVYETTLFSCAYVAPYSSLRRTLTAARRCRRNLRFPIGSGERSRLPPLIGCCLLPPSRFRGDTDARGGRVRVSPSAGVEGCACARRCVASGGRDEGESARPPYAGRRSLMGSRRRRGQPG